MSVATRREVDKALADFLYGDGLPLRLVCSPFFQRLPTLVSKVPCEEVH